MDNFWDKRYSEQDYVYGEDPNLFFKEQIDKLQPGTLILPCEGEGRNAVYAASHGWNVYAFDSSTAGKAKAMELAKKRNTGFEYLVEDAATINYEDNIADVVAFIYAHFPTELRNALLQKAMNWLKPGGKIIIEVFSTQQLGNNSGGPKDEEMLYTEERILTNLGNLAIELLQSLNIELSEGAYHNGKADIIRFIGRKSI